MQTLTAMRSKFTPPEVTPEQEARVREFEAMQVREQWRGRLVDAGIPVQFRKARISECTGPIRAYADTFTEESRRGLLLTGPYGCGKTTAACAVLIQVAKKWPVRFVTMPELVQEAMMFDRDALSRYRNTRLLVLDDLGKERPTEFAMEQVYSIVDYRWREQKPTIITTYHDADGLVSHFAKVADEHTAKAIMSRILGMCEVISMASHDRRLADGR